MLQAAGLVSTLDDSSAEITVFAPTDDAFTALASALDLTAAELLAKSELLKVVGHTFVRSTLTWLYNCLTMSARVPATSCHEHLANKQCSLYCATECKNTVLLLCCTDLGASCVCWRCL